MSDKKNLPTIADLTKDVEVAYKNDQLNLLLNQPPVESWVKEHPYIKGHKYIPIDKIELMLKRIFKRYRIEILREGVAFNGIYVVVRVHILNPVTNEWDWHDGTGAIQLQTKSGSTPADLGNINNGAVSMAFPIAKSLAVKDACDHIGELFGSNLNRKDIVPFSADSKLSGTIKERIEHALSEAETPDDYLKILDECPEEFVPLVKQAIENYEAKNVED